MEEATENDKQLLEAVRLKVEHSDAAKACFEAALCALQCPSSTDPPLPADGRCCFSGARGRHLVRLTLLGNRAPGGAPGASFPTRSETHHIVAKSWERFVHALMVLGNPDAALPEVLRLARACLRTWPIVEAETE